MDPQFCRLSGPDKIVQLQFHIDSIKDKVFKRVNKSVQMAQAWDARIPGNLKDRLIKPFLALRLCNETTNVAISTGLLKTTGQLKPSGGGKVVGAAGLFQLSSGPTR